MTRAVACLLVLLAGAAATAAPEVASHPVQVKIDGEPRKAEGMWLRYEREVFEQDLATFARGASGPADRAFVGLMRALRAGDVDKARPLLDVSTMQGSTAQVVAELRRSFDFFRRVQVVARAHIGEARVFYFRARDPSQGIYTAGFSFERGPTGWKGTLVTGNLVAASLIADGLDGRARMPSAFASVPRTDAKFAVPIDPTGSVLLEFDARRAALDPFDASAAPGSDAALLWTQGMTYMRGAAWAELAQLYTPASRRKIAEWAGRVDADTRTQAALVLTTGVKLLAEIPLGDTGWLLVFGQGETADPDEHVLRYAWVARTPQGPKLTNYFKRYALGAMFQRSPTWPKKVGQLRAVLDRFERK